MEVLLVALGLVVSVFGSCQNGELTSSGLSEEHQQKVVDLHNTERNLVAKGAIASQPMAENMLEMKWDNELALAAQRWADGCIFVHDQNRKLPDGREFGQNIAQVIRTGESNLTDWEEISNMVRDWFSEVTDYKPNDRSNAGHYSQMVWANSKKLGCGYTQYKRLGGGGITAFLVCNYFPAGNVVGSEPYKAGSRSCESQGLTGSRDFSNLCSEDEDDKGNQESGQRVLSPSTEPSVTQPTSSSGSDLALDGRPMIDTPWPLSVSPLQSRLSSTAASSAINPALTLDPSQAADSLQPSNSMKSSESTASVIPSVLPSIGMRSIPQSPLSNPIFPFYLIPRPRDLSPFLKYLAVVYMQGEPDQQNVLPPRTILRLIPTSYLGPQFDSYLNLERQDDNSIYYQHLPLENYQSVGAKFITAGQKQPGGPDSDVQLSQSVGQYPQGSLSHEDFALNRQNNPNSNKIIDGSRILDLRGENGSPRRLEYNVPSATEGFNVFYKQDNPLVSSTSPQFQAFSDKADRSLLDNEHQAGQQSPSNAFFQPYNVPQGFEQYPSNTPQDKFGERQFFTNFLNDPRGQYPSNLPLTNSVRMEGPTHGPQMPFISQDGQPRAYQSFSPVELYPPYDPQGFQTFAPQLNNFDGRPVSLLGSPTSEYSSPSTIFPDNHPSRATSPVGSGQRYPQSTHVWPENLRALSQASSNTPNNIQPFPDNTASYRQFSAPQSDSSNKRGQLGLVSPFSRGSRDLMDDLQGSQLEQEHPQSVTFSQDTPRDVLQSLQLPDSLQRSRKAQHDSPDALPGAKPNPLKGPPKYNSTENLQGARQLPSGMGNLVFQVPPQQVQPDYTGGYSQSPLQQSPNPQGTSFSEPPSFQRLPQSQVGLKPNQNQLPLGFPDSALVHEYSNPPSNVANNQQIVSNSQPDLPSYYQGSPESADTVKNPLRHLSQAIVPDYLRKVPSQSLQTPGNLLRYQQLPGGSPESLQGVGQFPSNNLRDFVELPQSQSGIPGDKRDPQNLAQPPGWRPYNDLDNSQQLSESSFSSPLNLPGSRNVPSILPDNLQELPYSPDEKQGYPPSSIFLGQDKMPYTVLDNVQGHPFPQGTLVENQPSNPSTFNLPDYQPGANNAPFYNLNNNQEYPRTSDFPSGFLPGSRNSPLNGQYALQEPPYPDNLGYPRESTNVPETSRGLPFSQGTPAEDKKFDPNTPPHLQGHIPGSNNAPFSTIDNNQRHPSIPNFPEYQPDSGNVPYNVPEHFRGPPNSQGVIPLMDTDPEHSQSFDQPHNLPGFRVAPPSQPKSYGLPYSPTNQPGYPRPIDIPGYPAGSRNAPSNVPSNGQPEGLLYPQVPSTDNNEQLSQTSSLPQNLPAFGQAPTSEVEHLPGLPYSPNNQPGYPQSAVFPGHPSRSRNVPSNVPSNGQHQGIPDTQVPSVDISPGHSQISALPQNLPGFRDSSSFLPDNLRELPRSPDIQPGYPASGRNAPSNGPNNVQEQSLPFPQVDSPDNKQGHSQISGLLHNLPALENYLPSHPHHLQGLPDSPNNQSGYPQSVDFPGYPVGGRNAPYNVSGNEQQQEWPFPRVASVDNNPGQPQQGLPYPQVTLSENNQGHLQIPSLLHNLPAVGYEQSSEPGRSQGHPQSVNFPGYPAGSRNAPSNAPGNSLQQEQPFPQVASSGKNPGHLQQGLLYPQVTSAESSQDHPQFPSLLHNVPAVGYDQTSQPGSLGGLPQSVGFPRYPGERINAPSNVPGKEQQQGLPYPQIASVDNNPKHPQSFPSSQNLPGFRDPPSTLPDSLRELPQSLNIQPEYPQLIDFPGHPSGSRNAPSSVPGYGQPQGQPYPQVASVDNNLGYPQSFDSPQNLPGFGDPPSSQPDTEGLTYLPNTQPGDPQSIDFPGYSAESRHATPNISDNGILSISPDNNRGYPQTLPLNIPAFEDDPSPKPGSLQELLPSKDNPGYPAGSRNMPSNVPDSGQQEAVSYPQAASVHKNPGHPQSSALPQNLPGFKDALSSPQDSPREPPQSPDIQPGYPQSNDFPGYPAGSINVPSHAPDKVQQQKIPFPQVASPDNKPGHPQVDGSLHNFPAFGDDPSSQPDHLQGPSYSPNNQSRYPILTDFPGYPTGSRKAPSNASDNGQQQGLTYPKVASADNDPGHPQYSALPQNLPGFGNDPSSQPDRQELIHSLNNQPGYPQTTDFLGHLQKGDMPGYPVTILNKLSNIPDSEKFPNNQPGYPQSSDFPMYAVGSRNAPSNAPDNGQQQELPYPQVGHLPGFRHALSSLPDSLQGLPQPLNNQPGYPQVADDLRYPGSINAPTMPEDILQGLPYTQSDLADNKKGPPVPSDSPGSHDYPRIPNGLNSGHGNPQAYDFPGYPPKTGNRASTIPHASQGLPYEQLSLLDNIQGYPQLITDSQGNSQEFRQQPSNLQFPGSIILPRDFEQLPSMMGGNQPGYQLPMTIGNERNPFNTYPGNIATENQQGYPQLPGNLYQTYVDSSNHVPQVPNNPNAQAPRENQHISPLLYGLPYSNQQMLQPQVDSPGYPQGLTGPVPAKPYDLQNNLVSILSEVSLPGLSGGQRNIETPSLPSKPITNPTSQPFFKGSRELLEEEPEGGKQGGGNDGTAGARIQNPDGQQLVPIGEANLNSLFGGDPQAFAVIQKVLRIVLPDVSQQLKGGQTTMVPIDLVRLLIAIILEFLHLQGIDTHQSLSSLVSSNGSVPLQIGPLTRPTGMRSLVRTVIHNPSGLGNGGRYYAVEYPVLGLNFKPGSMNPQISGYNIPVPLRIPMNVQGLNAFLTRLQIEPLSGVLRAEINPGNNVPITWTMGSRSQPFNLKYLQSNPPARQTNVEKPRSETNPPLSYDQPSQRAYFPPGDWRIRAAPLNQYNNVVWPYWSTGPESKAKAIDGALVRDYPKNQQVGTETWGQPTLLGGRQIQDSDSTASSSAEPQAATIVQGKNVAELQAGQTSPLGLFTNSGGESRTPREILAKPLDGDASASTHPASSSSLAPELLLPMQAEEPSPSSQNSLATTPTPINGQRLYLPKPKVYPSLFKNAQAHPIDDGQLLTAPTNDSEVPLSPLKGEQSSSPSTLMQPAVSTIPASSQRVYLPLSEFPLLENAQNHLINSTEPQSELATHAIAISSMEGNSEISQTEPDKERQGSRSIPLSQVNPGSPSLPGLAHSKPTYPTLFKNTQNHSAGAIGPQNTPALRNEEQVSPTEGGHRSVLTQPSNINQGPQSAPLGLGSRSFPQNLPGNSIQPVVSRNLENGPGLEDLPKLSLPPLFKSKPGYATSTEQSQDLLGEGQQSSTLPEHLSLALQNEPFDQEAKPDLKILPGTEEGKPIVVAMPSSGQRSHPSTGPDLRLFKNSAEQLEDGFIPQFQDTPNLQPGDQRAAPNIPIFSSDGSHDLGSSLDSPSPLTFAQNDQLNSGFPEPQRLLKHYQRLLPQSNDILSFVPPKPSKLGNDQANFQSPTADIRQGLPPDQVGSRPEAQIFPGIRALPQVIPSSYYTELLSPSSKMGFLEILRDKPDEPPGSLDPKEQSMPFLKDERHINQLDVPSSVVPESLNPLVQNPPLFRHFQGLAGPGSQAADDSDPRSYVRGERQLSPPAIPEEASSGNFVLIRDQQLEPRDGLGAGPTSISGDLGSSQISPSEHDQQGYKAVGSRLFKNYGGKQESQSNVDSLLNTDGGRNELPSQSVTQVSELFRDHPMETRNGFSDGPTSTQRDAGSAKNSPLVDDQHGYKAVGSGLFRNYGGIQESQAESSTSTLGGRIELPSPSVTQVSPDVWDRQTMTAPQTNGFSSGVVPASDGYQVSHFQQAMIPSDIGAPIQSDQVPVSSFESAQAPRQGPQNDQGLPILSGSRVYRPDATQGAIMQMQGQPSLVSAQRPNDPSNPNSQGMKYINQPAKMVSQTGQQLQQYIAYRVPAGQKFMSVQTGPTGQTLTSLGGGARMVQYPAMAGPSSNFQPQPQYFKIG